MEYIILETQEIVSQGELRKRNQDCSFPSVWDKDVCEFLGVSPILASPMPPVGEYEIAVKNGTEQDSKGNWVEKWVVSPMFSDITKEDGSVLTKEEQESKFLSDKFEQLKSSFISTVQSRLDDFAKTKNYDSILSACTYANSSDEKFQLEGQHCIALRDSTWNALFSVIKEIEDKARPVPSSFSDIESDLPTLEW